MSDDKDQYRALKRQAEQMLALADRLAGDSQSMTFGEFAKDYMAKKLASPSLRAASKRSFEHQVGAHLIPAFGRLTLTELEKNGSNHWNHWIAEMQTAAAFSEESGELAMRKFFNARKYFSEILIAAMKAGHIQTKPDLDNPDTSEDTGRILEDREVVAILWRARRPFRFIFYTFWKMGCRPREILQWEYPMMRRTETALWIDIPARISKTGRSRSIPINPEVAAIIDRRKIKSRFVFPHHRDLNRPRLSYDAAWRTACRRAKVTNAMPYDFRRTFITKRAASNESLLYVAKFLDTSTKMIEATYAKAQSDVMERIAK